MMHNSTKFNPSIVFNFRPNKWLFETVVDGILVVLSLYLLLALIFHELKIEQSRKKRFFSLSMEQKYGVLSKYVCIGIAAASLLRHSSEFGRLWLVSFIVASNNLSLAQETLIENACIALPLLSNLSITIGSGSVYLFLWFRQRVFYVHPSLKILSHRCLKIFSFGVIILWLLYCISLYPAYVILVRYHFVHMIGCLVAEDSFGSFTYIIISWGAMSIWIQLSLLFLFIYPILKRKKLWRNRSNNEHDVRLMGRVKKAVILTSVCLGTDLLAVISTRFLFMKNTNSIANSVYGVNLAINHLTTIACFDYWKQLLWPWNLKSNLCSRKRFRYDAATKRSSIDTVLSTGVSKEL